ncbi:MAG: hypothetical protein H6623_09780 [Bdellovibrionaceae bacterium]|nr:hypothetical protein [Pseudobdellovibrionaceae bacterium]
MSTHLKLFGVLFSLFSFTFVHADVKNFDTQVHKYKYPQFFDNNDQAFQARLFLLDNAPAGATVKVATFVFDYGERVKELSSHLCSAAQRKVNVELLVDSKAGDRVDQEDAFDSTEEIKKAEQLYAYLATCGVKVYIHNSTSAYATFLGKKMPNIFGVANGQSVSLTTLLGRVDAILSRLSDELIQPVLHKLGVKSSFSDLVGDIKSLSFDMLNFVGVAGFEKQADSVSDPIEGLSTRYANIVDNSLWSELDVEKAKIVAKTVNDSFLHDKGNGKISLKDVYNNIRRYNRLNHRKLFLVESADKSTGCTFIGGRNLGDHYLKATKESFHDGDVLLCRHHTSSEESQSFFTSVNTSFDQLRDDTQDPFIPGKNESPVRQVEANNKYKSLLSSKVAAQAFVAGIDLKNLREPQLLLSGWDPKKDQVQWALLRAIEREQKEIYIETAYAEFNGAVRRALEKALARGVRVVLITNGLFISDGASKLIRLLMRSWIEKTMQKYPKRFVVQMEHIDSGHMIHFKGAGFLCQMRKEMNEETKKLEGAYYRLYMIGSHNFHPRSGNSDKEHMLQWKEETSASCKTQPSPKDDLVAQRKAYYKNLDAKGQPQLMIFDTLYSECTEMLKYAEMYPDDQKMAKLADYARAIKRSMYKPIGTSNEPELLYKEEVEHMLEVSDQSGIHDLIGLFL